MLLEMAAEVVQYLKVSSVSSPDEMLTSILAMLLNYDDFLVFHEWKWVNRVGLFSNEQVLKTPTRQHLLQILQIEQLSYPLLWLGQNKIILSFRSFRVETSFPKSNTSLERWVSDLPYFGIVFRLWKCKFCRCNSAAWPLREPFSRT